MDKYDHRKFHAKKLAKERYSSLFFFFAPISPFIPLIMNPPVFSYINF